MASFRMPRGWSGRRWRLTPSFLNTLSGTLLNGWSVITSAHPTVSQWILLWRLPVMASTTDDSLQCHQSDCYQGIVASIRIHQHAESGCAAHLLCWPRQRHCKRLMILWEAFDSYFALQEMRAPHFGLLCWNTGHFAHGACDSKHQAAVICTHLDILFCYLLMSTLNALHCNVSHISESGSEAYSAMWRAVLSDSELHRPGPSCHLYQTQQSFKSKRTIMQEAFVFLLHYKKVATKVICRSFLTILQDTWSKVVRKLYTEMQSKSQVMLKDQSECKVSYIWGEEQEIFRISSCTTRQMVERCHQKKRQVHHNCTDPIFLRRFETGQGCDVRHLRAGKSSHEWRPWERPGSTLHYIQALYFEVKWRADLPECHGIGPARLPAPWITPATFLCLFQSRTQPS